MVANYTIIEKMNEYVERGDHEKVMYAETGDNKFLRMEWFYYNRATALADFLYFDLDAISESEYDSIRIHIFGI